MMKRCLILPVAVLLATIAPSADCFKCAVKTYVNALNAHDTERR